MDEKIESFMDLIKEALANVGDEYYKVKTTYEPLGIIRERVFCYELYHQMRMIQNKKGLTDIQIHGEIDKSGHRLFEGENPDFIFHIPGMMEGNSVVVEVKGKLEGSYQRGIYKDIQTLSKFTNNEIIYQLGLLIIYNYTYAEFYQRIGTVIKDKLDKKPIETAKVIILCKKDQHTPSEIIRLKDMLEEVENGRT